MSTFVPPFTLVPTNSSRSTHEFQRLLSAVTAARFSGNRVYLGMKYFPARTLLFAQYFMEADGKVAVTISPENGKYDKKEDLSHLEVMSSQELEWIRMYPAQTRTSSRVSEQNQTTADQMANDAQVTKSANGVQDPQIVRNATVKYGGQPSSVQLRTSGRGGLTNGRDMMENSAEKCATKTMNEHTRTSEKRKRLDIVELSDNSQNKSRARDTLSPDRSKAPRRNHACDFPGSNLETTSVSKENMRQSISQHKSGHMENPMIYICSGPRGCKIRYSRAETFARHLKTSNCRGAWKQMLASEYEELVREEGPR